MRITICMRIFGSAVSGSLFRTIALLFGMVVAISAQAGQVPDRRLIEWLNGPQQAAKEAVVASVLAMPPNQRSSDLIAALAAELERVNRDLRNTAAIIRSGGAASPTGRVEEYRGALVELLGQSSDPQVITALAGAVDGGPLAYRAVAKFGEPAVEILVRQANGERFRNVFSVAWSIRALTLITEAGPVSPDSQKQIVDAATNRLSGRQDSIVVEAACDLAVKTGDAKLRSRVVQLATDSSQVVGMGISDSRRIDAVQAAARVALGK